MATKAISHNLIVPAGRRRWEPWFAVSLGLLWVAMMFPLLDRVPRAIGDDSWSQAMAAYTLAFGGAPRNPGHAHIGRADEYLLEPRLFPSVVGALVYRVAGFGLVQGRLTSVLFSAIFLFAVYRVMRRLFGPAAAAPITVMALLDVWVFITSRTYRADIFLAALIWLSWMFFLESLESGRLWRAFSGGLLVGFAIWTHPNSLAYTGAALVAAACMIRVRKVRAAWLSAVAIGVILGVAPYLAYVTYAQAVSEVRLLDQVGWRTAAYARPLWDMLTTECDRWNNFLRLPQRLPLGAMYAAALIYASVRGRTADRLLVLAILFTAPLIPLVNSVNNARYLVVLVPAFAALIWRMLPTSSEDDALGRIGPRIAGAFVRRGTIAALLGVYLLMSAIPILVPLWGHHRANYHAWVGQIAATVPKESRVMGHTAYWTGLHDRDFVTSIIPPDWSVEQALNLIKEYRPDYLIQSTHLFSGLQGIGPRSRDWHATVFGRACEQVARELAGKVMFESYDRDFGGARVWRVQWPAVSATAK